MPDPYVAERPDSRRGSTTYALDAAGPRWWSREYLARGYASEVDARNAVYAFLAAGSITTLDGAPLTGIKLKDDNADGDWVFEALWEITTPTAAGGEEPVEPPYEYSFDIGTSTTRRTKSLDTIKTGSLEDEVAPNFDKAIGVSKDGVEGVEVAGEEGTEEFSVDLNQSLVTPAFRRSLRLLAGRVNSDEFIGHEPGEARFDGVRGTLKGNGRVRLTFKITWRENGPIKEYPLYFYDGEFEKEGWDYIWEYAEQVVLETETGPPDELVTLKYPGQRTVGVYVERIYERVSFALLAAILDGAGTGTYTPPPPPEPEP